MAIFDKTKDLMTDKVNWLYGDEASWLPNGSTGDPFIGKVLFNQPTKEERLVLIDFMPTDWRMEYKDGTFPGLFESANSNTHEFVIIKNVEYWVRKVESSWDGFLFIAILQPK